MSRRDLGVPGAAAPGGEPDAPSAVPGGCSNPLVLLASPTGNSRRGIPRWARPPGSRGGFGLSNSPFPTAGSAPALADACSARTAIAGGRSSLPAPFVLFTAPAFQFSPNNSQWLRELKSFNFYPTFTSLCLCLLLLLSARLKTNKGKAIFYHFSTHSTVNRKVSEKLPGLENQVVRCDVIFSLTAPSAL